MTSAHPRESRLNEQARRWVSESFDHSGIFGNQWVLALRKANVNFAIVDKLFADDDMSWCCSRVLITEPIGTFRIDTEPALFERLPLRYATTGTKYLQRYVRLTDWRRSCATPPASSRRVGRIKLEFDQGIFTTATPVAVSTRDRPEVSGVEVVHHVIPAPFFSKRSSKGVTI